jgi:photosystem II stability/assembly factor-like uncharacterized protein
MLRVRRLMFVALAACSFCTLFCPRVACAQPPGNFRILGPGGGGAMFHPAISPFDPQTVLVSCDMSGAYITHDGGRSWRQFNLRGGAREFVFDPVDAKVIYALGAGLWRSRDGGATWRLVAPNPTKLRGVTDASDEAEPWFLTHDVMAGSDGRFGPLRAFAVDPLNVKRMYMVVGSKLWRTMDGGVRWAPDGDVPATVSHLALLYKAGDHGLPTAVIAGDKGFVVHGVKSSLPLPLPPGVVRLDAEAMDVVDGKVVLLAIADGKLFVASVDVAAKSPPVSWKVAMLPGEGAKVTTAAGGHDGRTLYASFSKLQLDGKVWQGIAKSVDLGEHWSLVLKDAGQGAPNFADAWISAIFGSDWGEQPLGLAVSEKDHAVIYATDLGRTIKSIDGGAHWSAVYSHTAPDGGAASNGLDVLSSFGVYFDPFDAQNIVVPYTDVGLMRSENGGGSWRSPQEDVPRPWRGTAYAMVFDPAVRGRAWAVMGRPHDLPRARILRRQDVAIFRGGVAISADGGKSWSKSNGGMPEAAATDIVFDAKSPAKARTLFVAAMGRGVFKSVDGGKTWSLKNKGITQGEPLAWRLALAGDGTLYVVLVRKSEKEAIGGANDGALYRSRDGAETWERIALPDGVNGPNGLTIDPRDAARLYLAAWARDEGQHGAGGGIFGSTDGGAHWKPLFTRDQHVFDVSVNPRNPAELYAAGFEYSAWHSTDRGERWQRIAGYNFKAGHRVTPDPLHPGMVYINTFGGGIWYGRVDAKPGIEDMATKEIAP